MRKPACGRTKQILPRPFHTLLITRHDFDLERGRRLELDGLSGAIVRFGRQVGIPTPVHATVYAALKPFMHGTPCRSASPKR